MDRPDYLTKYLFDWESLDVVVSGRSALDSKFFLGPTVTVDTVERFLLGYGLDRDDPVGRAELFGHFQESVQFIRRYFLNDGDGEGLNIRVPNSVMMITDISDLFLMATRGSERFSEEETLWAEVILKIMHTVLHVDKDLRSNYFSVVQTQIFDRFYKYLHRDDDGLYLGSTKNCEDKIRLIDFETKAKKSRDSVIIKLLHKVENVAEELFDRVGVRIVTESKFDTLRAVKFLIENYIVIPHNIKPSRSLNTLINVKNFKDGYTKLLKDDLRHKWTEDEFLQKVNNLSIESSGIPDSDEDKNKYTSSKYQSIQFTCRQLIKYKNPFMHEFGELRKEARKDKNNQLAKKILSMDYSLVARDIKFFYPYEVQIVDNDSHNVNTEGEASHVEYKKSQTHAAMKRVFGGLIKFHNIKID